MTKLFPILFPRKARHGISPTHEVDEH
jgi:hypothetical protein